MARNENTSVSENASFFFCLLNKGLPDYLFSSKAQWRYLQKNSPNQQKPFLVIDINRSKCIIAITRAYILRSDTKYLKLLIYWTVLNFRTLNEWNVRTLNRFMKFYLFVRQNKKRLRNLFSTRKGKFINYIAVSVCQNVRCCHPVKILLNIQSWWRQKWYNCIYFLLRLGHIKITKHLVTFFPLDNSYWRVRKYNN